MFLAQIASALADKPIESLGIGAIALLAIKVLGDIVARLISSKLPDRRTGPAQCNMTEGHVLSLETHVAQQEQIAKSGEKSARAQEKTAQAMEVMSGCLNRLEEGSRRIESELIRHDAKTGGGNGG